MLIIAMIRIALIPMVYKVFMKIAEIIFGWGPMAVLNCSTGKRVKWFISNTILRIQPVYVEIISDICLKIVKECSCPLTARACADLIITDLAVIEVTPEGLVLKETAPGWTAGEVQALTEPGLIVSPGLKEIEL